MTPFTRSALAAIALCGLAGTVTPASAAVAPNWEESGEASWYGPGFHGRRTSSGEIFDSRAMTAAHDSLPLGTRVLVTAQETGRSTVVTITDRQPTKRLRIIDVSRAAAAKLGLLGSGVAMVTLSAPPSDEPVEVAEAPDDAGADDAGVSPPLRGPRHTRHVARKASAHR